MTTRNILRSFVRPTLLVLSPLLLAGCEKELEKPYQVVSEDRFPTILSNALGLQTKYATGETVPVELRFAKQDVPVQEIRIFQRIEPAPDSAIVQTIPASRAAFSRINNADTLVVNFVMPTAPNKSRVRMSAVVVSQNGLTKTRSVNFRVAEATPTVRIASVTNVTAPTTAAVTPGDVVRYNLVLNENGINTYPELPTPPPAASAILFNNLDSLITYVRVGTTPERRVTRQRLPAAGTQTGAQTAVSVDVTIPAASSGQQVVYRFEAKSRFLGTPNVRLGSATATAITPVTPTNLAAVRSLTLTYTGTTGGDQAALDLTTFTTVAAAGPNANKDVAITSIATNNVRLQSVAPNATRFVRSTSAVYGSATLNSIRQAYLTAPAANQLTTLDNVVVGDVIIARLRNADQYAIFTITGINRTATTVTMTLDVKAL
jgi:hypothetical protein